MWFEWILLHEVDSGTANCALLHLVLRFDLHSSKLTLKMFQKLVRNCSVDALSNKLFHNVHCAISSLVRSLIWYEVQVNASL